MDEVRIRQAADSIAKHRAALKWLEEYGQQITERDEEQASVRIHLHFAGACPGSKEASEVLASYARLSLPEIVKTAIRSCRNTIDMEADAIRREGE